MLVNAHKLFIILLLFIGWNTVQAQEEGDIIVTSGFINLFNGANVALIKN